MWAGSNMIIVVLNCCVFVCLSRELHCNLEQLLGHIIGIGLSENVVGLLL